MWFVAKKRSASARLVHADFQACHVARRTRVRPIKPEKAIGAGFSPCGICKPWSPNAD